MPVSYSERGASISLWKMAGQKKAYRELGRREGY